MIELIRSLHVLSAILLTVTLTMYVLTDDTSKRKKLSMAHGILMLLLLAFGLLYLFQTGIKGAGWLHAKYAIYVVLGVFPLGVKKLKPSKAVGLTVLYLLVFAVIILVNTKPF